MFAREISCLSILSFETQMYLLSSRRQIHFKPRIYRSYHKATIPFQFQSTILFYLGIDRITQNMH